MNTSLYCNNLNKNNLLEDLNTLSKYEKGDKLAVVNGKLSINKQGISQSIIRTARSIFSSGYNRDDVAKHLDLMIIKIQSMSDKEKIQNNKLLRSAKRALEDVSSDYKSDSKFWPTPKSTENFLDIVCRINDIVNVLDSHEFKATEDFNKMDVRDFGDNTPKGILPERVVALSQGAEKDVVSKTQKVAVYSLLALGSALVAVPALLLTAAKWIFWNPIEFIFKGEIRTKNPVEWSTDQFQRLKNKQNNDAIRDRQDNYTLWLFDTKRIDQSHVQAVKELPYISLKRYELTIKLLGARVFFENFDEVQLYIEESFEGENKDDLLKKINDEDIKKLLNEMIPDPKINTESIEFFCFKNFSAEMIKEYLKEGGMRTEINVGDRLYQKPEISYKTMKDLYLALADHKELKELTLPETMAIPQPLIKELLARGFRPASHHPKETTYIR